VSLSLSLGDSFAFCSSATAAHFYWSKKSTRQDWPTLIFYAFHTAGVTWRASVRVSYFNN
jgi:hypothetical protein